VHEGEDLTDAARDDELDELHLAEWTSTVGRDGVAVARPLLHQSSRRNTNGGELWESRGPLSQNQTP
jgi:hypothetical protein